MAQPNHSYDTITYDTFSRLLESYKEHVPKKLDELEEQRLKVIPEALSERTDDAHLKKIELQKLLEWKLYVEALRVPLPIERHTRLILPAISQWPWHFQTVLAQAR